MELDPIIAGVMGSSIVAAVGWLVKENAQLKAEIKRIQGDRITELISTLEKVHDTVDALKTWRDSQKSSVKPPNR